MMQFSNSLQIRLISIRICLCTLVAKIQTDCLKMGEHLTFVQCDETNVSTRVIVSVAVWNSGHFSGVEVKNPNFYR